MRRSDREIKEYNEIIGVIEKCDVCRLALNNNGYPYIIPLNFGFKEENGKAELYFHCANEGTKLELIKKDNRASFETDCRHRLVADYEEQMCTMEYESVIGQGRIEILPEEEKIAALQILMSHYHHDKFPINENVIPMTTVFRLSVDSMTGKRRIKRK